MLCLILISLLACIRLSHADLGMDQPFRMYDLSGAILDTLFSHSNSRGIGWSAAKYALRRLECNMKGSNDTRVQQGCAKRARMQRWLF